MVFWVGLSSLKEKERLAFEIRGHDSHPYTYVIRELR